MVRWMIVMMIGPEVSIHGILYVEAMQEIKLVLAWLMH